MANHANKGPRKITMKVPDGEEIVVYSNQKVVNALGEIQDDMNLYEGVRLSEVIEAVYDQGVKDGKGIALDALQERMGQVEEMRPKKIGRPKKQ